MAHRFSFAVREPAPEPREVRSDVVDDGVVEQIPMKVTPAMVSEAAEGVLEGVDPRHAHVMRNLWVNDPQSDAARLLFQSEIVHRARSNFVNWDRPELRIRESLDTEQMARCVTYAPEMQLIFQNNVKHDHPLFSAVRKIDHQLLLSRFPHGMKYADIGGNVMFHVQRGDVNCTVISPDADDKDPQRRMLTELQLRKMQAVSSASAGADGFSEQSRRMAASILAGESKYVVREKAQHAKVRARMTMSCHVYDIPMQDWPWIMENLGSVLHEGCVHFSNQFFEQDVGELDFSGARYVIDKRKDTFSMGLGSSHANWYTHKWSEFMRYGANQILYGKVRAYSYQITERRGDTIFFRIMEIDASAKPDMRQVYRLPTVEMVEVHGFAVGKRRRRGQTARSLVPQNYLFPARLWNTMLSYAKIELDRGGLDYNKMANYYRTAVPRQSINSVTISGGEKVPLDEVPALIVMAAAVASVDILVVQQSIEATTHEITRRRSVDEELTLLKVLNVFYTAAVSFGFLAISPFAWLGIRLESKYLDHARSSLVSWEPRCQTKRVPAALIVDSRDFDYELLPPREIGFSEVLKDNLFGPAMDAVDKDPKTAAEALEVCGEFLPSDVRRKLQRLADQYEPPKRESVDPLLRDSAAASVVDSDAAGGKPPSYKTEASHCKSPAALALQRTHRREAIKEAISESELESGKLQAACNLWFRKLLRSGIPDKRLLKEYAEEMGNPDIWRVQSGCIVSSELGQSPESFRHAGVYTSVPDSVTGSHLRVVQSSTYNGPDHVTGDWVSRRHYTLRDEGFSGYVLVLDELKIYNGPEIRATLNAALQLPDSAFDTEVVIHQGPPGCGKTTSIVNRFQVGPDIVLCPVRESLLDTTQKLKKKFPHLSDSMFRKMAKTLDSLLVNWDKLRDRLVFDVALGDECFITHSGKWYAAMALLGVRVFHGYGDKYQIAHAARVDVPQQYVQLQADLVEESWITYRCAPEILATWNGVYNDRVRSAVRKPGKVVWLDSPKLLQLKFHQDGSPAHVFLCMYQADKKTIEHLFPGKLKANVMTTHEAQGKAFDQVILFNFEMRVRSEDDKFYLFIRQAYCNVALSRARTEFVYVKQSRAPDLVTQWIERSNDPRRVAAAADVRSAGTSMPFLV